MSGRRPTPREPRRVPSRLAVGLVCMVFIGLLGWWAWCAYAGTVAEETEPELPAHRVTHDSMTVTYTYDGEMIRWYVMVDPDSGVQYLVNDRGGCCPRLSYDGSIMGVWGDGAS